MTKRHRLEDLGKLSMMLKAIVEHEIFEHADSKHGYEEWVKLHHDKIEYDEPRGLCHIFHSIKHLNDLIQECYYLALGEDDEC